MLTAFMNRDPKSEGLFWVGVKTTGIFCRPTCRARKPKRQNIEFFPTTKDALDRGFRPCKICRPMKLQGEAPDWLRSFLDEIDASPDKRMKDDDIRSQGVDPNRLRRWFKKHHRMTFQAYLRSLRIGRAFGSIAHGEKVIDTAFLHGYESLSGFTSAYKKELGESPRNKERSEAITVTRILTPLGPMLAGATEGGICLLEFMDRRMLETQLARLKKKYKGPIITGDSPHFKTLKIQLRQYFEGCRKKFELPLVVAGTRFQKSVWKQLMKIPYGGTCSYKDQAKGIGNPKAVRAVARANGDNRIGILIPCHRVIGADGKLVGYGGGLWRKKHLLRLESGANG